jgi:hypothetical protein
MENGAVSLKLSSSTTVSCSGPFFIRNGSMQLAVRHYSSNNANLFNYGAYVTAVIPLQTLSSWPLPAQGLWPIKAGETEGQEGGGGGGRI